MRSCLANSTLKTFLQDYRKTALTNTGTGNSHLFMNLWASLTRWMIGWILSKQKIKDLNKNSTNSCVKFLLNKLRKKDRHLKKRKYNHPTEKITCLTFLNTENSPHRKTRNQKRSKVRMFPDANPPFGILLLIFSSPELR